MVAHGPYNDLNTDQRVRFWAHFLARHPAEADYAKTTKDGMRWHRLSGGELVISLAIGLDFVRVFVRGERGAEASMVEARLLPAAPGLAALLCVPLKSPADRDKFFSSRLKLDMNDEGNWDQAADFLWDTSQRYEQALRGILGMEPSA